ncbi:hypothetical protein GRJ2_000351600 [Grus japonensis]|uniref:Uncharacterized protein n=1 Tax=Grus japonensis TaxID=30415 RepID=A0ABC9W057_GRUJA
MPWCCVQAPKRLPSESKEVVSRYGGKESRHFYPPTQSTQSEPAGSPSKKIPRMYLPRPAQPAGPRDNEQCLSDTLSARIPSQDPSLVVQEIRSEEEKRKLFELLIFSITYI